MNDYVLLTDSSADLTDALVKELGVEVLPLSFTMRNKTYRRRTSTASSGRGRWPPPRRSMCPTSPRP